MLLVEMLLLFLVFSPCLLDRGVYSPYRPLLLLGHCRDTPLMLAKFHMVMLYNVDFVICVIVGLSAFLWVSCDLLMLHLNKNHSQLMAIN